MASQPEITAIQPESPPKGSNYRRLFRNSAFTLLWGGQTISNIGDPFFNLAVMWVIYTQSGSTLQTAIVQVLWHLSKILFGPLAGALADRWDRKRIIVITNVLAAVVVSAVATAIPAWGPLSPVVVFVAVFLLNTLTTFSSPAHFSIMPEVVGRDLLATASGLLATTRQVASLAGNALAGVVIALVGTAWALVVDACTFLFAALAIAVARLPVRTSLPASSTQRSSLLREIVDGWRAIVDLPIVRALVWLSVLINISSFIGPLFPALVRERLRGDATAYGTLEAMGVIGGIAGSALAGMLERRLGVGRLLVAGWGVAGTCAIGMAASVSLPLTAALETILAFGLTVGGISVGVLTQALSPENYRGRVAGITAALIAVAIPPSTLVAGWLADIVGVAPLLAVGGAWILGIAGLAWANPHVRTAHI